MTMNKETVAVIDFETTGLSPRNGARATEIGITLLRDGNIVDRFQSLMNTGSRIPPEIVALTGITNQMLQEAPSAREVISMAYAFVGDAPLVAHNSTFDQRFWAYELEKCNLRSKQKFVCTMLLSRRIYPHAPNHKLSTLTQLHQLASSGQHHRAQADADMAAKLYLRICQDLNTQFGMQNVSHSLLSEMQSKSAKEISQKLGIKSSPRMQPSNSEMLGKSSQHFLSSPASAIKSIPSSAQSPALPTSKENLVSHPVKKSSGTMFWICVWAFAFVFLMGIFKR